MAVTYKINSGITDFIYSNGGAVNEAGEHPTDISQFTFLDINNLLSFGNGTVVTNRYGTHEEIYNYVKETTGLSDVMYSLYKQSTNGTLGGIDFTFPSTLLQSKNTSAATLDLSFTQFCFVVQFIALKKLGIFNANSMNIYNINDDGSLSYLSDAPNPFVMFKSSTGRTGVIREVVYLLGDWNEQNVLDGSKWRSFTIENSGSSTLGILNERSASKMTYLFADYSPPDGGNPDNPYEPGGPSGEGGGGGSFDDDSDIIGIPDLPTLSAANTGFTRIYNPTLSQVQDLARYLWTDETVVQTIWNHIKQFFENPMEAIIGFNLVPVPVPDGGTQNFALMYIDTGVQMTVAANQFVDVDCGTLEIKQYFGSALDYAPYTKISCYLPYIGVVTLNTDEVMGRTLQVVYRVDICSGSCVAYITVDGNAIYQYSGHCAINIPISAADFSSYVNAAISVGKLAGTLALGASGIAGAAAVSEVTQTTGETTSRIVNTERNAATGRQITTGTQTVTKGPQEITTTKASYSGIPPANITNTAGEVISSKPHVEHSGSFSGNSGYLGVRRPFVIIQRPNMCMPENYQTLNGFPSMITMKLSECTGFTRIQQVQLTNMGQATNPEQAEIQQLLKMGVIF